MQRKNDPTRKKVEIAVRCGVLPPVTMMPTIFLGTIQEFENMQVSQPTTNHRSGPSHERCPSASHLSARSLLTVAPTATCLYVCVCGRKEEKSGRAQTNNQTLKCSSRPLQNKFRPCLGHDSQAQPKIWTWGKSGFRLLQ